MRTEHDLTPSRVPIEDLIEYPGNPRDHDIPTIRTLLREHGQYAPVYRQASTGYLLKGHGTTEAARQEGWTHLQVITLDVDDVQARKMVLGDNRASDLAGYEQHKLAALLQSLEGDLTGTGYDDGDLDARLAALAIHDTQGRSSREELAGWEAKDARTILLTYTVADHQQMVDRLDRLAGEMGVDTFSDVVRRLVEDADQAVEAANAPG